MRVRIGLCALGLLVAGTVNASAFSATFRWCSSGSPAFSIAGVPKGTTSLQFHMIDLDLPSFNHGGGILPYTGQTSIPCGALSDYSPPSPPSGSHSYQFTVTAFGGGNGLGTARSTRKFPEK